MCVYTVSLVPHILIYSNLCLCVKLLSSPLLAVTLLSNVIYCVIELL